MKKLQFKILVILLLGYFQVNSQKTFDVRFALSGVDCVNRTVCYDVQIRSANGTSWGLAGQNYRIFYNSALASYISGTSLLPTSSYTNYVLVQDVQDANASGVNGPLAFEATLGFLNYYMDLNDVANGGISLPANGNWVTTSNLCFNVDQSVFDDPNICLELVWARDGLTNDYATAFVEVSQWVGANNTTPAVPNFHDDMDASDGEQACLDIACAQPGITVSDITVNENAGTATVQLCLSAPATTSKSITASTQNGTAFSGSDYSTTTQTLTFGIGETCKPFSVPVINDNLIESIESFNVLLSNPSGVTILDGTGVITILDDEPPCGAQAPSISGN